MAASYKLFIEDLIGASSAYLTRRDLDHFVSQGDVTNCVVNTEERFETLLCA